MTAWGYGMRKLQSNTHDIFSPYTDYSVLLCIIVRQSKIGRWGETEVLSISIYSVQRASMMPGGR